LGLHAGTVRRGKQLHQSWLRARLRRHCPLHFRGQWDCEHQDRSVARCPWLPWCGWFPTHVVACRPAAPRVGKPVSR
ncbi:unnamed protein product, partial [Symbiodinium sp. CCMP2456]